MKRTVVHSCDPTILDSIMKTLGRSLQASKIVSMSEDVLTTMMSPDGTQLEELSAIQMGQAASAFLAVYPEVQVIFTPRHVVAAIGIYTDTDFAKTPFNPSTPCAGLRFLSPADIMEPSIMSALTNEE